MFLVRVSTVDAELDFYVPPDTLGQHLFAKVCQTLGVKEEAFFGLQFRDHKDNVVWLRMDKKVQRQNQRQANPFRMYFCAKFYPKDVSEEIYRFATLKLFYSQVKKAILTDEIYCHPETSVLLASYAVQAKFGDHNQNVHDVEQLAKEELLPKHILKQYDMTREEWAEKVLTWWPRHQGMSRKEAMQEYLKMAQELDMYGMSYFEIKNKRGTYLLLGVDALGLNIFTMDDRLMPKIGFSWAEIRCISYSSRKFYIKSVDRRAPDFVFISANISQNKTILDLCIGNHQLYMRRPTNQSPEIPTSPEISWKTRVEIEQLERERVAKQKEEEMDYRMKNMQEEIDTQQRELFGAQKIRQLEEQVRLVEVTKKELVSKEGELDRLTRELKETKLKDKKERDILLTEIRTKQQEISRIKTEIDQQNAQVLSLQNQTKSESSTTLNSSTAPSDTKPKLGVPVFKEQYVVNPPKESVRERNEEASSVNSEHSSEDTIRNLDEKAGLYRVRISDAEAKLLHVAHNHKYDTLRRIRQGNTKRRIDQFENL